MRVQLAGSHGASSGFIGFFSSSRYHRHHPKLLLVFVDKKSLKSILLQKDLLEMVIN